MKLSPHEVRVLNLLALGHTDLEIAAKLKLTRGTARVYVHELYHKLGLARTWGSPRVRLVLWWLEKKAGETA